MVDQNGVADIVDQNSVVHIVDQKGADILDQNGMVYIMWPTWWISMSKAVRT